MLTYMLHLFLVNHHLPSSITYPRNQTRLLALLANPDFFHLALWIFRSLLWWASVGSSSSFISSSHDSKPPSRVYQPDISHTQSAHLHDQKCPSSPSRFDIISLLPLRLVDRLCGGPRRHGAWIGTFCLHQYCSSPLSLPIA